MIQLERVEKHFGHLHVLKNINLQVASGEKLVVIGPSGSGKSTLIRCMNLLEKPSHGTVRIEGDEITHHLNNNGCGMQFAAAGARILENARRMGLGTELSGDFFLQKEHT